MSSRPGLRRTAALAVTGGILAATVSLAGAVAAPLTAAQAAGCNTSQVAVVVDFSHWGGGVTARCVTWSSSLTGYDALHDAGFSTSGTQHDGPGFICRIDAYPTTSEDPCRNTPPASASWSYFHANSGASSWSYSQLGAMSYHPVRASADAWTFAQGQAQPSFSTATYLPRGAAPSSGPSGSGGSGGSGRPGSGGSGSGGSGSGPTGGQPVTHAGTPGGVGAAQPGAAGTGTPGSRAVAPTRAGDGKTPAGTGVSTPRRATATGRPGATGPAGGGPVPMPGLTPRAALHPSKAAGSPVPAIVGGTLAAVLAAAAAATVTRRQRAAGGLSQ